MAKKKRGVNERAGEKLKPLPPAEVERLLKASAAAANELGRYARAAFCLSDASARLRLR